MRTKVAGLIVLAACLLGLSACDKDSEGLVVLPEKAPRIITQPASVTVAVGAAAQFTVVAEGDNLSYQWSKDGATISGATSTTLTIPTTNSASAGVYRVAVSNATSSTTSTPAVLTLTGATLPPAIVTHPESTSVLPGALATLTVVASGTPPLTYQWYRNDVAVFGETAATFTLQAATVQDAGNYTVTVTNTQGTVTSNVAVLTVSATPQSGVVAAKAAIRPVNECNDSAESRILAEKAGAAWSILFGQTDLPAQTDLAADMQAGSSQCESGSGIATADSYPISTRGVLVSSLRADQQDLVTAAIAQFVLDYDDATSAHRLAELTSGDAYADTYIAWGNAADSTSGNMAKDATYLLINGPRLWIEIFRRPGGQDSGYRVVVTAR